MGSEGLQIASAAAVRFIISILKLILNPKDSICKTVVSYEYACAGLKLPASEALQACFLTNDADAVFSQLFSEEQNIALQQIKNASVYDLVEKIISLFDLGSWYNETAFVQGFQDVVFKFTNGKNTDIYSFVKWWDTTGYKQSISTPENANAFRVMTIHKSKGLDFKVVIIPFCDWELTKKNGFFKNILWTEPDKEPFNELPLIPVEYSSKLAQSIFAPQYFDELMHQYIDNLNVAYVAFTRAKHELFCIAPKPKKDPESEEKVSSIAALLYYSFTTKLGNNEPGVSVGKYDAENFVFEAGNAVSWPKDIQTQRKEPNPVNYPSVSPAGRLRLRNISTDVWLDGQQITDSKLNLGTIMHEILQTIHVKQDAEAAIVKCERDGRINASEAKIIEQMLAQFWLQPETEDWFSGKNKVLNEAVILTPGAKLYRPDRVVINGNKATVIDYKFGEAEKESYLKQVKNYMKLIAELVCT
jgi:ATP-dependent exoDNAse (exonuclease V) beta subunit